MRNITIGIIARDEEIGKTEMQIVTKNNLKYLNNKCNYIGILNYNNEYIDTNLLDICDGLIFQGGKNIYPYHFQILEYAINNNIPVLGICMGHQIIGLHSIESMSDSDLIKVDNHNDKKKLHQIKTTPNSFINRAIGNIESVNTRHEYALKEVKKPFKVTALSEDNVIEAIEFIDNKHFIIGVQFHPEDLDNTEKLYNIFLKEVIKRKKNNHTSLQKNIKFSD